MGVIYWGVRRVPVPPLFGLRGTVPLTFQDEKVKNWLSPAVNRGDLRKLSYNKTIFGQGSASDPAERAYDETLSQTPDEEGILPPHFPPLSLRTHGRLVLLLNRYPHFLDQSYAPDNYVDMRNAVSTKSRFHSTAIACVACFA